MAVPIQRDQQLQSTQSSVIPYHTTPTLPSNNAINNTNNTADTSDTASIATSSAASYDSDSETSTLQPNSNTTPAPSYPPSLLPTYTSNYRGAYATEADYLTALRAWAKEKEYMKPSEGFGNLPGFYGNKRSEDYIARTDAMGMAGGRKSSNNGETKGERRKSRDWLGRTRTRSGLEGVNVTGGQTVEDQGIVQDTTTDLDTGMNDLSRTTSIPGPTGRVESPSAGAGTANGGRRSSWWRKAMR